MKMPSILSYGLMIIAICSASCALAKDENTSTSSTQTPTTDLIIQPNKIFDPNTLSFDSVQIYEKNFVFDWDNYSTFATNKKKMDEIDIFIKNNQDYSKLNNDDQQALGRIVYKLGTFYIYALHEPSLGIEKLDIANELLKDKKDKAWNYNQLAFAYEQKYAVSDDDNDKNKALDYTNKVITELYPNANNKEVAFAYYVHGLVQNDSGDYDQAQTDLQKALKIYETIPGGKGDRYAIAKNTLANIVLNQDGHDKEVLATLQQLEHYWESKGNIDHNPYAAINLLSLGQAYMKLGNTENARDEFKKAISILQNTYGNNSQILAEPYQLLSDTYKKLGNQKLSSAYEHKANVLSKS